MPSTPKGQFRVPKMFSLDRENPGRQMRGVHAALGVRGLCRIRAVRAVDGSDSLRRS